LNIRPKLIHITNRKEKMSDVSNPFMPGFADQFQNIFMPKKPHIIHLTFDETNIDRLGSVHRFNRELTSSVRRNAFFIASVNQQLQESAIFILLMQQFKKKPNLIMAQTVHDISIKVKNSGDDFSYPEPLGRRESIKKKFSSFFRPETIDVSYEKFIGEINIGHKDRQKIDRHIQNGDCYKAFDAAHAIVCKMLLDNKDKDGRNIIQIMQAGTLTKPKAIKHLAQLRQTLTVAGFDVEEMGLY
ncbi:hypothetical protein K2X14_15095, partial [Acetobacter sp. TBRC 12305]